MWKLGLIIALAGLGPGCSGGHPTGPAGGSLDASASPAGADAAPAVGDADGGPEAATYRTSLSVCWTDASCERALAVGHGGIWNTDDAPYDSNKALAAAYEGGADAVKIDVRFTADDIAVISHSSPIEAFESVDCYNEAIEEMTAAEVTACHRFPTDDQTFQRLDDVMAYLRGKMVVQLTVKRPDDYARAIEEVHALGAEDYSFIEISLDELETVIPGIEGSDTVYYIINLEAATDRIDELIAQDAPRAIIAEFDPDIELEAADVSKLHAAGIHTFTYQDSHLATTSDLEALYEGGYDIVSANDPEVLDARVEVNESRNIDPP